MRFLAPLFAVLSFFASPTYTDVIDHVSASVVRITGSIPSASDEDQQVFVSQQFRLDHAHYSCTGFVIDTHRVLTAAHCIGQDMTADGAAVAVLKTDVYYDLALLDVQTDKRPLVFRADPVVRFEDLTAVGYAWGWPRLSVLAERSFLINFSPSAGLPPGLMNQFGYIGGMSGGPVVDHRGEVVGIVQRSNEGIGYGVGVLLIRAFLLGV